MLAVYKGHLGMAQLLLKNGANPNLRKKVKTFPHFSVINTMNACNDILFSFALILNLTPSGNRTNAQFVSSFLLSKFSEYISVYTLNKLVQIQPVLMRLIICDPQSQQDSFTALMMATVGRDKQMVDTLLEFKADVNQHADLMVSCCMPCVVHIELHHGIFCTHLSQVEMQWTFCMCAID